MKGCLAHLAALASVFLATSHVVSPHVEASVRPWLAGVAAVLLTLGLSSSWSLARGYGQGLFSRRALLSRAATGEPPPEDGPMIVTGAARPLGAPLRAPVSGAPCVAYRYRMYYKTSDRRHRVRRVSVYWGYACRPFRIDAAGRAVRVMAVPRLADETARLASPEDVERAREHVATARFEDVGGGLVDVLETGLEFAGEMFQEDGGESRRDWRKSGEERDPATLLLEETVLPVGATATVAGWWSADRQAVVPASGDSGPAAVTVVFGPPGRLSRVAHALPSSPWSVAVAATLLTGLGAGLVWLALTGRVAPLVDAARRALGV